MTKGPLSLTRAQILGHRRAVGALDERLPPGSESLRRAGWAGLQDSMPRAALLSIHARVEETEATAWEDPSLVQVWGPRFSAYVVPAVDRAIFTLGRLPDEGRTRSVAMELADRLDEFLAGRTTSANEAGHALGVHPNAAPLRRADWPRADPMGWRQAADDLDRAGTGRRPPRCPCRARPPIPACVRSRHARGVRRVGRDQAAARSSRVRGDRALTDGGQNADRRRLDPRRGRDILQRSAAADSRRSAPSQRRHVLPPPGIRSRAPGAAGGAPSAHSGPRASGRVPSSSMARSSGRGDARWPI